MKTQRLIPWVLAGCLLLAGCSVDATADGDGASTQNQSQTQREEQVEQEAEAPQNQPSPELEAAFGGFRQGFDQACDRLGFTAPDWAYIPAVGGEEAAYTNGTIYFYGDTVCSYYPLDGEGDGYFSQLTASVAAATGLAVEDATPYVGTLIQNADSVEVFRGWRAIFDNATGSCTLERLPESALPTAPAELLEELEEFLAPFNQRAAELDLPTLEAGQFSFESFGGTDRLIAGLDSPAQTELYFNGSGQYFLRSYLDSAQLSADSELGAVCQAMLYCVDGNLEMDGSRGWAGSAFAELTAAYESTGALGVLDQSLGGCRLFWVLETSQTTHRLDFSVSPLDG